MKKTGLTRLTLIFLVFIFSCSSNSDFKKDVAGISESMCRNIEIMNKLKAANPADSATVKKLQADAQQVQAEMKMLYKKFTTTYKDKLKDDKFNKSFSRELRKSLLDCPHLSKQERENFERELSN
jgi:hypothetical protein